MKRLSLYCFLFVLLLASCQKDDIEEVVVTQEKQIAEARQYFENHIAIPSEETTEGSSSRNNQASLFKKQWFKHLDWSTAYIRVISTGEAIIVPIVYTEPIYTPKGDYSLALNQMSYVMMYRDEQNEFQLEVVLTIPDAEFLSDNRSYDQFTGNVMVTDWKGNFIKGFRHTTDGVEPIILATVSSPNTRMTESYECITTEYYNCTGAYWTDSDDNQHWSNIHCELVSTTETCSDSGGSGINPGGSAGNSGNYNPGGGDNSSPNKPKPGKDNPPIAELCPDGSVKPKNGECPTESPLDQISNCDELSTDDNDKLKNVVDDYKTKCTNLQIYQYIVGENKKFCFKIDETMTAPGGYKSSTGDILFSSSSAIDLATFGEEFFHGYQDLFYNGLSSSLGRSNIEFEAKLYHDLTNGGWCCITFMDPNNAGVFAQYVEWISQASNDFTTLPSWSDLSEKYFYFLEEFIKEKPDYNYPIDYNLLPNALLNLNDC